MRSCVCGCAGGFNFPHGIMKKLSCLSKKAASTTDLYIKEDHAQPPPPPPASNFPPIWPHPKAFTSGKANISVVGGGAFTLTATKSSKDLTGAFARFTKNCFPHNTASPDGNLSTAAGLAGVTVTVADTSGTLQLDTDESYTLDVPLSGMATITAPTVFGAMHGLETLSQLVSFDFDTQSYGIARAPWHIDDAPRFKHREVLVDTSRHFEPVETLKKLVQSLTYSKVNTVHWHLVDQQSFPFDSKKRPELSKKGAYSPQERYTALDIAEVVEFGRERGVRMMVEIDGPGHAAIWCKGYPEICPSATCLEPLDDLLDDLTGGKRGSGLFYDNIIHLGGDEVNTACYESTPSIAAWLKKKGLTADGGYEYFVKQYQAIAHAKGRDVAGWEEIWKHFGTELAKSTIIHQWLPGSTMSVEATKKGYRCLWSTDGVW
jgi:hexosaminidase